MEEQKEQQKIYGFLQMFVYFFVLLDISINIYVSTGMFGPYSLPLERLSNTLLFRDVLYTKFFTLLLVCLIGIGTLARKNPDADPKQHVAIPLGIGLVLLFTSIYFLSRAYVEEYQVLLPYTNTYELIYAVFSFIGPI